MKKIPFVLGLVVVLAAIMATIWLGGNSILVFVDVLSLVIIILFAFPSLIGTFGWKGFWKSFRLAFSRDEHAEREEYARAWIVLKTLGRMIYMGGVIGSFIGIIGIFAFASGDAEVLRETANYSVALLGIFYSLIINLVLIEPLKAYLKSRSI